MFCVITPTLKKEFSETIKEYYFFMFIVLTSKTNVYTFIIKSRENINKKNKSPRGQIYKKGVLTPSWRVLGSKKCHTFFEVF